MKPTRTAANRAFRACGLASFALVIMLSVAAMPGAIARADAGASDSANYAGIWWIYLAPRPHAQTLTGEQRAQAAAVSLRAHERLAQVGWQVRDCDLPVREDWIAELRRFGIHPRVISRWENAVSACLDEQQKALALALPFVREIRPVACVRRLLPDETAPLGRGSVTRHNNAGERPIGNEIVINGAPEEYGPSFGQLAMLGIPELHAAGRDGRGVLIAVLDSGFHKDHPALSHLDIIAERDFVDGDDETQNWDGVHGRGDSHGTLTLTALAGLAPGEMIGPAYHASFALARTEDIDVEVRAEEDHFVAALEWADSLGAVLVNTSLGYRCFPDDEGFCYEDDELDGATAVTTRAVNLAARRGMLVVTAAGNVSGEPAPLSILTPADSDSCIAVGALYPWGEVAGFSSRGPTSDGRIKPDLCAQGSQVVCARWFPDTTDIGTASGTSLATPLVTGLAALLLQDSPRPAMELLQTLRSLGDRSLDPDCSYGYGIPWAPLGLPGERAALGIDSLSWTLPPAAGWRTELSLRLRNRGTAPNLESAVRLRSADTCPACDDESYDLAALAPGDTAWVGPWSVDLSDLDFETWASLIAEIESDGEIRYRAVAFRLDYPLVAADWRGVRPWPQPWTRGGSLRVLCSAAHSGTVDVTVFDIAGREVADLGSQVWVERGNSWLEFPAERLSRLESGRYVLRLSGGGTDVKAPLLIVR